MSQQNLPSAPASDTSATAGFRGADLQDIEAMSYEQARDELITVVSTLETGGAPLEESLALWQRGEALADRCERWLDGATQKLAEVREQLEAAEK